MKKTLLGLTTALLLSGCSTMTIHPQDRSKLASKPTHEETLPFYFWGLKGEHRVDVKKACGDKEPIQMQTQATLENGIFTAITLGIYAPHTAKVWCR